MACPYFVPREILSDGSWLHPSRLPLGAGWSGECCASDDFFRPDDSRIRECCNLGYATGCPQLPANRDWDAIRFAVARGGEGQIVICYICERSHAPSASGRLVFDLRAETWLDECDPRVRRLAVAFLESYRSRGKSEVKSQIEEVNNNSSPEG